jgi:hypothetical protein
VDFDIEKKKWFWNTDTPSPAHWLGSHEAAEAALEIIRVSEYLIPRHI